MIAATLTFARATAALSLVDAPYARSARKFCSLPPDTATGEDDAAADPGTVERDSDPEEERPQDTPRQRAAALVWDASYSSASCDVMVQHGLLDICAALLRHSQTIGDGERRAAHLLKTACSAATVISAAVHAESGRLAGVTSTSHCHRRISGCQDIRVSC